MTRMEELNELLRRQMSGPILAVEVTPDQLREFHEMLDALGVELRNWEERMAEDYLRNSQRPADE